MNNLVETDTYFPTNGITITLLVHAFRLIGTEKKVQYAVDIRCHSGIPSYISTQNSSLRNFQHANKKKRIEFGYFFPP
jgi:hypothetical protein